MNYIAGKLFNEERDLFCASNLEVTNCKFVDGESPLKHSNDIVVKACEFGYKYPLWYAKNIFVEKTTFHPLSRSGIWYTESIKLKNCLVEAPKEFRRSKNIEIESCEFKDSQETLWGCNGVKIKDSTFKGDYLLMNSKNIEVDNMKLDGNYVCDGSENVVIRNSIMNTKDAFWNSKNILIENCKIVGEYFGWNSENITLKNCEIESLQGFCYIKNLVMVDCILKNTTLAFEYSTVNARILSRIGSIKNPSGGKIECYGYDELILDEHCEDKTATIIEVIHE